jgi:hypothetical protein
MKFSVFVLASTIACGHGFIVNEPRARSTVSSLDMGDFLDGNAKKNDIMVREDEAMWVDEGDAESSGGWSNPFAKKKADAKQPTAKQSKPAPKKKEAPKKAASGGFKLPWDK